jgi:hypothetical protein
MIVWGKGIVESYVIRNGDNVTLTDNEEEKGVVGGHR